MVPELTDEEDAIELDEIKGEIEFKDVWFAYKPDEWVLQGVSFHVQPKQTVAFVGSTGSGKTRTVISIVDVLLRHGWVKNVLFLADRNSLVTQAKRAFVNLLPNLSVVNLCEDKENYNARGVFSTYQTIIHCIDSAKDENGGKLYTVGHFDLITKNNDKGGFLDTSDKRYLDMAGKGEEAVSVYRIGGIELNEDTKEVLVDGEPVKLTPMEFKILSLLMRNPGRVFSAEEIYERVWNERAINTDTVMVHVRKIREKIEYNPKEPKYLKVVWGIGYKFEKNS